MPSTPPLSPVARWPPRSVLSLAPSIFDIVLFFALFWIQGYLDLAGIAMAAAYVQVA